MRRFRPLSTLCSVLVATAALSTAVAGTAGGQPTETQGRPPAEVRSTHSVTLVTGDVVHVTRFADGRQSAVLQPAPGSLGGYRATEVNGELYVTPHTAAPYLASGQLDRELFNVSNLIEFGYDDAGRSSLPLIVQYGGSRVKEPRPVPAGAVRHVELSSVNARGVEQDKRAAADFWEAVDDDRPVAMNELRLADGISKIWLDAPVQPTLAESVPQIGAPQAWAAGYDGAGVRVAVLDSGVDPNHPDLAGKIVASRSFVPNENITDRHGHGTHVAAIVAGSGAASGGQRKGVAPGAELVIGKVLSNRGLGDTAWIIAAMEWAAVEQDADVINMSLGSRGFYSDGTDPASQAVNALTAATGALFVIAAANDGPNAGTVTSPAAANAALSVGAVDKSDVLAPFSSRGPRTGDFAVKPEVTAPGVRIIAARAAGTALGTPVDDRYTSVGGTSMAAPHVAGAAAILAQRYPGWQAEQLKSALVSTTTPGEYTPFQQGTGRIDLPRALNQGVYASPSTLAYGLQTWPHQGDPAIDKIITYRNDSAAAVTLQLDVDVTDDRGNVAGDGLFRVSPATVTVPPGGTQPVTLTFEPGGGDPGVYVGTVTATGAGGATVRTAFSVAMEPELYTVTVPGITRDGRPANGRSDVELFNLDTGGDCTAILICHTVYYATYGDGTPSFRVPPGRYSLMAFLNTNDAPNVNPIEVTLTGYPTLEVTRDMTVTLDAREAVEVVIETPKVTEPQAPTLNYYRAIGPNRISSFGGEATAKRLFVRPTGPVTEGEFEFNTKWRLYAPQIQGEVVRPEQLPLQLQYMTGTVPMLDGTRRLPVVYVGAARPEDFAGRDVRGKIALVRRTAAITFEAQAANAAAAGAGAVVIHNDTPGLFMGHVGSATVPVFSLSYDEGRQLVELLQRGPVTVRLHGIPASPYKFDVIYATRGEIPADPRHRVTQRNSARVTMDYHDPSTGGGSPSQCGRLSPTDAPSCVDELREGNVHSAGLTITSFVRLLTPHQREEWISGDGTWWRQWLLPIHLLDELWVEPIRQYSGGQRLHESWFESVLRPAPVNDNGARRTGDLLHFGIAGITGAHPNRYGVPVTARHNPLPVARLYRNGQLVGERTGTATPGLWQTDFTTTPERANYRLTLDTAKPYWWGYSTTTNTVWTFRSQRTDQTEHLPLMHAFYDMRLDLTNRTAANTAFSFGVRLGRGPDHTQTAMREVKVWASFNDGGTWRQATVAGNNGSYTVVVDHPRLTNTTGYVSLRIRAVDADGNTVDQTVIRAYGLS